MIVSCSSCAKANRLPARRLADKAHCGGCKAPLVPLGGPVELANEADFDELVRDAPVPVLVDFFAEWCGPCRAVGPEIAKVARRHAGRLVVAKIDTDALEGVARRFGIRTIPTMILFCDGRAAERIDGAMSAAAIEQRLSLGSAPHASARPI